jgi:Na+-translocating ferredoxin:NAD+ oxidoreductase subunit G
MNKNIKMILVLTVIALLCSSLLSVVNNLTREPILQAVQREKKEALRQVLPDFDNDPFKCRVTISNNQETCVFHIARKNGEFAAAAFEASSDKGYGGTIKILAGVKNNNTLSGLAILQQNETPGLGAKITDEKFKGQFQNKNINQTKWKVKKDGGDIDAITGATISPTAVLDALSEGLKVYTANKEKIINYKCR